MVELCKNFIYRVQSQDTINSICLKFNTNRENIVRNNENIALYEGELIEITTNDYTTHIVKPAQTLEQISQMYSVEMSKKKKDNLLEGDKLFIGQSLKIFKD